MQKPIVLVALFVLMTQAAFSQKYFSRDAVLSFNSDTPMEKIEGVNKAGTCVLDTKTGKMEWKVLVKGFKFEKALMEEHFNENYMESTKFPNAVFKGEITNLSEINFTQDGKYNVKAKGTMTMHGVSKEINVTGTLKVNKGQLEILSNFAVACADYNISIPSVVKDNIAKEIKVTVSAKLNAMK